MPRPSQPYYVPRLRCPLTLVESIALALRLEKVMVGLENVFSEALTQILADCGATALDHFRTIGAGERTPRPRAVMDLEKTWWGAYLAGPLQQVGGVAVSQPYPSRVSVQPGPISELPSLKARPAAKNAAPLNTPPLAAPAQLPPSFIEGNGPYRMPEALFWPLGGVSSRGMRVTCSLQCADNDAFGGWCERTNPFSANITIEPIGLLRVLLLGGASFYRACVAQIAHHEVAHLNAFDSPHNRRERVIWDEKLEDQPTDSAYRLSSIELFAGGRGYAALLYRLGLPWSDELPNVYGCRFPDELHVFNCRFPLPRIAGWDVEERRRMFLRIGQHYYRHLGLHCKRPGN